MSLFWLEQPEQKPNVFHQAVNKQGSALIWDQPDSPCSTYSKSEHSDRRREDAAAAAHNVRGWWDYTPVMHVWNEWIDKLIYGGCSWSVAAETASCLTLELWEPTRSHTSQWGASSVRKIRWTSAVCPNIPDSVPGSCRVPSAQEEVLKLHTDHGSVTSVSNLVNSERVLLAPVRLKTRQSLIITWQPWCKNVQQPVWACINTVVTSANRCVFKHLPDLLILCPDLFWDASFILLGVIRE